MASEALILFIPFVVICIIMRNINAVERNTLIPVLTISLIWLYHYIPLIVNRVTNNFFLPIYAPQLFSISIFLRSVSTFEKITCKFYEYIFSLINIQIKDVKKNCSAFSLSLGV